MLVYSGKIMFNISTSNFLEKEEVNYCITSI